MGPPQRVIESDEKNLDADIFREVFQSASDAIWLWGLDENGMPNRLIEVNDRGPEMLGYTREELMEMTPKDFVAPEFQIDMAPIVKEIQETGRATYEMLHIRKDGSRLPVENTSRTFKIGDERVTMTIVRDITERKEAEKTLQMAHDQLERRVEDRTAKLRESEVKYHTLFENVKDAIFITDMKGRFIEVNQVACNRLGYSRKETLQMSPKDIGDPESAAHVEERMEKLRQEGHIVFESVNLTKEGARIPVEISVQTIDYGGRPATLAVSRDITVRKEAERAMKESERRFRGAFENAAVGASMVDLKGRFLKANHRLCEILGYSEKELLTKTFSDVTHPDDLQIGLDKMKEMIQGITDFTSFEKRYYRKDGNLIYVNISPSLIRNEEGEPQYFVGLWQDITEGKKAEEAIKASEEKFRNLFESSTDAIHVMDTEGNLLDCNKIAYERLGYTKEEMVGKDISQLDSPGDAINVPKRVEHLKNHGKAVFEAENMRKDGTVLPVEVNASVIEFGGEKVVLALNRDITERKEAEEELKDYSEKLRVSLDEKDVLLKEVHHRVKNNMQIISSLLNLQKGYIKDNEAVEIFTDSQNRIKSMALVHESLYKSPGLSNINMRDYVNELTTGLIKTYRTGTEIIDLKTNVEDVFIGVDTAVPCGLILNELVTNSLKHAFPGEEGGEIWIRLRQTSQGQIELAVGDNGVGIPEEIDVYNTETLGLDLIKSLTKQLKGEIDLKREDGTEFVVIF